jgi:hypothetical protein
MTVSLPVVLALIGTVLMAFAIFLPMRPSIAVETGTALEAESGPAMVPETPAAQEPDRQPWPVLVEAQAADCDVPARLELVDALATLRSAWAIDVLVHAEGSETDPTVHAAIAAALRGDPAREPGVSRLTSRPAVPSL